MLVRKMELLSNVLRPKKLDEVIGQNHLIGDGKILSNMVKNKKLFSMILYGQPGIGKTSIVEGLAFRIQRDVVPDGLKGYSIVNIKTASLIGTTETGETRLQTMVDELKKLDKEIQELENQRARIKDAYIKGIVKLNDFEADYKLIEDKLSNLETQKLELINLETFNYSPHELLAERDLEREKMIRLDTLNGLLKSNIIHFPLNSSNCCC
mgnify:CR=1 FL=1